MMNKKQTIKLICFLALFLILLRGVSYAVRTNGDVKDRFVGFYAEGRDTIDVMFFGSSQVYPCFATPQLYGETGVTGYALSTNVQRPAAMLWLTKEALKTQSPALCVYDLHMFMPDEESQMKNMAYTRGVTDNLKYSFNRFQTVNALVPADGDRLSYHLDIFKYHSNWKTLALPSQLRTFFYRYPHPLKGYAVYDNVGQSEPFDASGITDAEPVAPEQEAHLKELLTFLTEQKQDAIFIVMPGELNASDVRKYHYIEEIVRAYDVAFLDMNLYYDEIGIDFLTDYNDQGTHTNARGAKKVTAFFGAYLKDHYDLPDHRGDAKYRSWDDAYALLQERYEAAADAIAQKIENGDYWLPPEDAGE